MQTRCIKNASDEPFPWCCVTCTGTCFFMDFSPIMWNTLHRYVSWCKNFCKQNTQCFFFFLQISVAWFSSLWLVEAVLEALNFFFWKLYTLVVSITLTGRVGILIYLRRNDCNQTLQFTHSNVGIIGRHPAPLSLLRHFLLRWIIVIRQCATTRQFPPYIRTKPLILLRSGTNKPDSSGAFMVIQRISNFLFY